MSTQLPLGSKVSFLNDIGQGKIIDIEEGLYLVEDEHGFEFWHSPEDLVPLMKASEDQLLKEKELQSKNRANASKNTSVQNKGIVERKVDLHMENLVLSQKGMTNHEILLTQISHFKRFLAANEKEKVGRLIVVHGQGTGKLKSEIRKIVEDIKGAEIFDADYLKYGQGASIIERKYNIR